MPYGTNLPGQTICYRTQRQVLESFTEVQSCAAQLPQTAHHALQLPYTIFGLGLAPNFLDYVYVNVTNTSAVSQSKIWPQVNPSCFLKYGKDVFCLPLRLQKASEIRDYLSGTFPLNSKAVNTGLEAGNCSIREPQNLFG